MYSNGQRSERKSDAARRRVVCALTLGDSRKEKRKRAKLAEKRRKTADRRAQIVSSLSPLDVQSALTDAAAVSRADSVDVCGRITAKVFETRGALAARE